MKRWLVVRCARYHQEMLDLKTWEFPLFKSNFCYIWDKMGFSTIVSLSEWVFHLVCKKYHHNYQAHHCHYYHGNWVNNFGTCWDEHRLSAPCPPLSNSYPGQLNIQPHHLVIGSWEMWLRCLVSVIPLEAVFFEPCFIVETARGASLNMAKMNITIIMIVVSSVMTTTVMIMMMLIVE